MRRILTSAACLPLLALAAAPAARAQTEISPPPPTLNFYIAPGLMDMPSGEAQPNADLSTGVSYFANTWRTGITFQFADRLSGTFRYAGIMGLDYAGYEDYYDRSFDLRILVLEESTWVPAVTVGLQDLMGTGLYSAEYIAATKAITPEIKVTAGLGWGRLGSFGAVGSPFGERPSDKGGEGGELNINQWFRGPMAPFGGIEWRPTDRLGFKLEYSSDAYVLETEKRDIFERKSPINFGAEYQVNDSLRVGAYGMYGSEFGVNFVYTINPARAPTPLTFPAPRPISPRAGTAASWSTAWTQDPGADQVLTAQVRDLLKEDGLTIESIDIAARQVTLRYRDIQYDSRPNGMGRAARVLATVMPPSVEVFRLIPIVNGVPVSAVTVRRTDLETLELNPWSDRLLWDRTVVEDAGLMGAPPLAEVYPNYSAALEPYARVSYFDPDAPFRVEVGLSISGSVEFLPGLVLEGSVSKPLAGNLDSVKRKSDSVLPHVRTDWPKYARYGDPSLDYLTLSQYFRPGEQWFGRVSAGYLETMFAGVSGEVLWKPVDSPLALGAELNYVFQRDFDQGFGLRDYQIATGHASAYYDFGNGFLGQVNAGRYLAGDYGATFSVDRFFSDGWSVGAFFTLTNVSPEEFGEGSFDKGIRLNIPMTWLTGKPSQTDYGLVLRPVQRDGGQMLNVRNRLFGSIRAQTTTVYENQWGRFWR